MYMPKIGFYFSSSFEVLSLFTILDDNLIFSLKYYLLISTKVKTTIVSELYY